MTGQVHGDQRSCVYFCVLSLIVANASHTCESIMMLINTAYDDHKDLPTQMSLNMDNASPNHCILVLAFCSLYVMEGIVAKFRVRFLLENHAHDIYDIFRAITVGRISAFIC